MPRQYATCLGYLFKKTSSTHIFSFLAHTQKFAQDFFEDKLYISGTVPESVSLQNYLISDFFIRYTSLKHPALCSHTE